LGFLGIKTEGAPEKINFLNCHRAKGAPAGKGSASGQRERQRAKGAPAGKGSASGQRERQRAKDQYLIRSLCPLAYSLKNNKKPLKNRVQ